MKNKKILTIMGTMLLVVSVCCTGCRINIPGKNDSSQVSSSNESTEELKTYTFTENVDTDVETPYTNIYTLTLLNNDEAKFEEQSVYNDDYHSSTSYTGSYVQDDDSITFTYTNSGDLEEESWETSYVFYIDGDEVTSVVYASGDFTSIQGEYICDSDEYGSMTLSITKDGSATLTMNDSNTVYTGSVMQIDERIDLMVSSEDASEDIDWYVDFGNGTFTYESYLTASYGQYAGTYVANGQLGEITFVCNEDGTASADVTYEGETIPMAGNFYVDSDTSQMSIYLCTEDSYSISVTLSDIGGGELNYTGTLTLPLYAG